MYIKDNEKGWRYLCLVACKVEDTQHVIVYQDGKRIARESLKKQDCIEQVVAVGAKLRINASRENKSEFEDISGFESIFNGPIAGFCLWHRPLTLKEIGAITLTQMPAKPWKPWFWSQRDNFAWTASSKDLSICPVSRVWVDLKHGDLVEVKSPAAGKKKQGVLTKTDGKTCSVRFKCSLEIKEATYGYGNDPSYRVHNNHPLLSHP